jgi:hypothetical protein
VTIVCTFRRGNDPHSIHLTHAITKVVAPGEWFITKQPNQSLSGGMGGPAGAGNMLGGIGNSDSAILGNSLNPPVNPALSATDAGAITFLNSYPGGWGVQGNTGGGGTSGVSDFELLGDLQLRQGRVQEAIQAYQKAVDAQTDRQRKAFLYQKMAQALFLGHKSSVDNTVIAKALEYLKHAQQNAQAAPPKTPALAKAPALLTSKLIVSVSKEWLDAASERKLPVEAFRQGVHIERIAIPLPEQKEVKGTTGH